MSETLTTTTTEVVASDEERAAEQVGALAEQIVGMLGSATELLTIELGRRFGLYRTLHESGPMTATAFAEATRVAPRYAREWLEQQAAAGYLTVVEPGVFGHERRFVLPDLHVPVLVDETHPAHVAPAASLFAGVALAFPELVADYRRGRGVAFDEYGAELRGGLGSLNRPGFTHELRNWVDAMPDRAAALDAGGAVLDAGCGVGWSTIALAHAFPNARIVGLDLDEASIIEARRNARDAGVADRISFLHGNAGDKATVRAAAAAASTGTAETTGETGVEASGFDLVTVFEALHDMGRPVDALAWFRALLRTGGALLVADERVADAFHAGAEPVERMLYAMSVLHCLPATTAESGDLANGTVLRAPTLRRWAAEAGFGRVDVLDIENPFWRFYRIG
ncbi:class I SAM-dependent methyltransferase [Agromyces humatus]|uniref:Methyltransferase domain-containing protein n=1 Tax=Agromyces humatus TaxID=279573 RepID=A0ABP4X3H7_9MICO|nr:class I SAM-dependent methyltransferase [Agromyces humatus]